MSTKERKDVVFQVRITESEKKQLMELLASNNQSKHDVITYYIIHNSNEIFKLKNEKEELIEKISDTKKHLETYEKELKDIKTKLREPEVISMEDALIKDVSEKIKANYKIAHKEEPTKNGLASYINSDSVIKLLDYTILVNNIKDTEDFKNKVYDALKLER